MKTQLAPNLEAAPFPKDQGIEEFLAELEKVGVERQ
jgi:hypothetical protein